MQSWKNVPQHRIRRTAPNDITFILGWWSATLTLYSIAMPHQWPIANFTFITLSFTAHSRVNYHRLICDIHSKILYMKWAAPRYHLHLTLIKFCSCMIQLCLYTDTTHYALYTHLMKIFVMLWANEKSSHRDCLINVKC